MDRSTGDAMLKRERTSKERTAMDIYNSPRFSVVLNNGLERKGTGSRRCYEILDKIHARGIVLVGYAARLFGGHVHQLIQNDASLDEMDRFLLRYEGAMNLPLTLH